MHRRTKQNLQPSDGVMIVVPSACLTKTLTQQLVVYSFALDNRMCSSIRPQIIQCVKIRSCVCVSFLHTHICAGYVNMSQFTGRRDGGVRGTRAEKGGGHVKEKAGHRGRETVTDKEVLIGGNRKSRIQKRHKEHKDSRIVGRVRPSCLLPILHLFFYMFLWL